MKASNIIATVILTLVALVARAETDPAHAQIKARIKAMQTETKTIRQQTKALKDAQQGPILAVKLSKAQAAREKAQAALIKAQGGVK